MPRRPRESLELDIYLAVAPARLWEMWLHPVWHARFTGGAEAIVNDKEGELYSCWNGYIEGRNLSLEPGARILQSWRTADFAAADMDSLLELRFSSEAEGTRLSIRHTELPHETSDTYRKGWEEYYFQHMRELFKT